jgi:hypothetical protein
VGFCASLDGENTGNDGMSSETGKGRAWTQCKGVKDAQGSPMAMRADYNKDTTLRTGRVIAQLGAGALSCLYCFTPYDSCFCTRRSAVHGSRPEHRPLFSILRPLIPPAFGGEALNAMQNPVGNVCRKRFATGCCQAATILAIGHWDVGRL